MTSTAPTSHRTAEAQTDPAAVVRAVLHDLETAWNAADGAAFGEAFASDATFVTVRGDHVVGRDAIAGGHAGIFATIYAGSRNQMELVSATEIGPGVVIGVSTNTLECPAGPLAGVHQARSTIVVTRGTSGWQAVACHNTLVAG